MKSQIISFRFWLLCAAMTGMISCSKETIPGSDADPDPAGPSDLQNFYKLLRVENFGGDTLYNGPVDGARSTIYFSLEENKGMPDLYEKTNKWDITFSGIANCTIKGNNGKDVHSFGFGSSGVGGVYITDKPFGEVTEVPADDKFRTEVSLDENGAFGNGIGWVFYDWGGSDVADGSYEKEHVAYALGNPLTLKNGKKLVRTVVVRTAKGNYAKIKMISLYKNAFTPEQMFRKTQYPFFTFEYIMVPKGSTRFETR